MDMVLIRHAEAEDHASSDGARQLTPRGARVMREAAQGLRRLVPTLDVIVASPLVRARQTAEIVARAYARAVPEELALLAPGVDANALTQWLARSPAATIALVGHEPDMGALVAYFSAAPMLAPPFAKGAAALLRVDTAPRARGARLLWLHTPVELARAAESP